MLLPLFFLLSFSRPSRIDENGRPRAAKVHEFQISSVQSTTAAGREKERMRERERKREREKERHFFILLFIILFNFTLKRKTKIK
jgi:hypothetical protein